MRISNKPTQNQQLLTCMMEECGELTQACSKVIRFGFEKIDDVRTEAGDVLALIDLMVEYGWITQEQLENRKSIKRNKLKIYSDILK